VSSHAAPAEPPSSRRPRLPLRRPRLPRAALPSTLPRVGAAPLTTLALSAALLAIVFEADGGLQLGPLTTVEIAVELAAGALVAAAVLAGRRTRGAWGMGTFGLLGLLAALTAVSIAWAIDPAAAWDEANRTLSYLAAFAAGLALVRLAPDRWASLLHAIVLTSVAVSAFALLTKVLPGTLNPDEVYARLREPFGYWNAVGVLAALGGPACLWLGSRRDGHAAATALAYPALGLLLLTILLSYSRGALFALAAGCILWFAVVPLRLRGVAVLAVSAVGAVTAATWAFGQRGLSEDRVGLTERSAAGTELGIVLVVMVAVLLVAGLAVGFLTARRAPSPGTRRQLGVAVAVVGAIIPILLVAVLALSERGLGGSISNGWSNLTDPEATLPTNSSDRLTAVGSVRARYWNEALKIFEADPWVGVGAGGYAAVRPRYRRDTFEVRHAHGYAVQTLADLGIAGAMVSLALLAAFLAAAVRTTALRQGSRVAHTPERVGMLTLLAVVVTFGLHSFVDWTWFVPGTAIPALLAAGWLAGRGPVVEELAPRPERRRTGWVGSLSAAGIVLVALVAAWQTWQPLRSVHAADDALAAADARRLPDARDRAARAADLNPLSVEPLFARAAVEVAARDLPAARRALEEGVRRQPGVAETWLRLAELELTSAGRPEAAQRAVGAALYLDPRSPAGQALFLEALRRRGREAAPGLLPQQPSLPPATSGGDPGESREAPQLEQPAAP
jgi:tetratricopeptide (TPR) repeat protein